MVTVSSHPIDVSFLVFGLRPLVEDWALQAFNNIVLEPEQNESIKHKLYFILVLYGF